MLIAGLLASQVVAMAAGVLLLFALRWHKMPLGLFIPAAWLAGSGLIAAERLLLAQIGLPWNTFTLAPPWLLLAGVAAWRVRTERPGLDTATEGGHTGPPLRQALSERRERAKLIIELMAGTIIVLWTAALMRRTLAQPLTGWDALVDWIFKARVFYQSGTIPLSFLRDTEYGIYAHLDYPLFVPLSVARIYEWIGDQEIIAKGWWALLAGAAAAGLYFGLKDLASHAARLVGLVVLIGMPAMTLHGADGLAGYAELPLAVLFLYGALFLHRWLLDAGPGNFGLSALFFGMTGFTKNEGLVVAIAGIGLLVVLAIALRRTRPAPVWQGLLLAALVAVPWQVEKTIYGISGDLQPGLSALLQNWQERIGTILRNLGYYASDVNLLNLVWPLLPILSLAVLLFAPRRWLITLPLLLLIAAHLAGTLVAFITTPHDIVWHLGTAADRLVFQPILVGLLAGTIYLSTLLEREVKEADATYLPAEVSSAPDPVLAPAHK